MIDPELPLTAFEEYLLWEDRPAYPWSVQLRISLAGRLDRAALECAMRESLQRHPLLRSRLATVRGRRTWVASDPAPVLIWNEAVDRPGDEFPQALPFDLASETGLRVFADVGPHAAKLVLQFHHVCCDGVGIDAFLNDFLILYANQRVTQRSAHPLPPLEVERLAQRGRYGLTWSKLLSILPRQLVGLQGARQFYARRPIPIVPHSPRADHSPPPSGYPSGEHFRCSIEETAQLRASAQRLNVSMNDVLARDLFIAMTRWRREQGTIDETDWLRMMVPMNLRVPGDEKMPSTNVVSSVFLDRRGVDAHDPDRLLASIHDEIRLIKRNQLGLTFLFSLMLFRWLPGGMRRTARQDRCSISCIFTNVGRMLMASPLPTKDGCRLVGDLVLEDIQFLVPLRPYNCVTFCASQYGGRLGVDLHYDPEFLTVEKSRRLMELFAEQLRPSITAGAVTV